MIYRIFFLFLSTLLLFTCSSSDTAQEATDKTTEISAKSNETGDKLQELKTTVKVATDKPHKIAKEQFLTTSSGLKYADIIKGKGDLPRSGEKVFVHYTGWLTNEKRFDSSVLRNKPFDFILGQGMVIKGWDEGVADMNVGGIRQLVIPPHLAYGERGAGGVIPPNATLIFEVNLLDIKKTE